mmetsp:Transcript_13432/g.56260  ORF Transcript_13432/g.56260 Transcript_13432/m.56260 type:complete len:222 (-) Transcript_13432:978-1643(-)
MLRVSTAGSRAITLPVYDESTPITSQRKRVFCLRPSSDWPITLGACVSTFARSSSATPAPSLRNSSFFSRRPRLYVTVAGNLQSTRAKSSRLSPATSWRNLCRASIFSGRPLTKTSSRASARQPRSLGLRPSEVRYAIMGRNSTYPSRTGAACTMSSNASSDSEGMMPISMSAQSFLRRHRPCWDCQATARRPSWRCRRASLLSHRRSSSRCRHGSGSPRD